MKRYNLFMESRYRFSTSSSYSSPPGSPDHASTFKKVHSALPSSPLLSPGLMERQRTDEDPVMAEKRVEPVVITARQDEVQAHTQPELIKVPTGEDPVVVENMLEPEVIMAQQVEAQEHAKPDLIKVSTTVKADEEYKVKDNKVPVNSAPETLAEDVEQTHVAIQSSEDKTYSQPHDLVAINTETLLMPSSPSNTEPALKPEPVLKPVETEASETLVQARPTGGDTGSVDKVPQSETSSCKREVAANVGIGSAAATGPGVPSSSGVQPLVVEDRNSDATGDTKVGTDGLTSLTASSYKVGLSNVSDDFSDNSSWTTEEEGESIEEDDPPMETTTVIATSAGAGIVKCETVPDVNANITNSFAGPNTESAQPLDCIKKIRDLVVEVIEVEEVPQHYPDHEVVRLGTQ